MVSLRGARTEEDYFYFYFYFYEGISEVWSLAGRTNNVRQQEARKELSREKRRLFMGLTRGPLHLYGTFASRSVKALDELGVLAIYLGYPLSAAQGEGNELTLNSWSYRKPMGAVELKAQECGVRAFEVVEYNTSKYCAFHGGEVGREPGDVVS